MNHSPARQLGDVCIYCRQAPGDTWDHVIPISRGGRDSSWNMRPCCRPCNQAKADRLPSEWLGAACPQWARELEAFLKPRPRPRRGVSVARKLEVFDGARWSVIETGLETEMQRLRVVVAERLGVPWEALRVEAAW